MELNAKMCTDDCYREQYFIMYGTHMQYVSHSPVSVGTNLVPCSGTPRPRYGESFQKLGL